MRSGRPSGRRGRECPQGYASAKCSLSDPASTADTTSIALKGSVYCFQYLLTLGSRMARPTHVLRVYVAGETGRSRSAVQNLKKVCEKELAGQYRIEVIDVSKNPQVAIENNLIALPAVFRTLPSPVRKFVGNWVNDDYELVGFGLITQDKPKSAKRSAKR
jgi:circadian clock protein KaiB